MRAWEVLKVVEIISACVGKVYIHTYLTYICIHITDVNCYMYAYIRKVGDLLIITYSRYTHLIMLF